jgi:hypothetical protein
MTSQFFIPSRTRGLLFHIAAIVLMLTMSAFTFLTGLEQEIGGYFLLLLLLAVLFFAPLPPLVYSAIALLRARYFLERDGLHLRWGLRVEDIPLTDIEWARLAEELPLKLPIPHPSWPGALLGTARTDELGTIEYLASSQDGLLLVATRSRVFAISPADPQAFLRAIEEVFEMGSLEPIRAQSVVPAAFAAQVWHDRLARWLLVAGIILAALLFIGISLVVPGLASASLGFYPDGQPLPPGPPAQLILLPILAMLFYLIDLATGLFFFRRSPYRALAYMIWGSSILTTLLLISAAFWVLI